MKGERRAADHRVGGPDIVAGICQFQAEDILPIRAAVGGIGRLAANEPFEIWPHQHGAKR